MPKTLAIATPKGDPRVVTALEALRFVGADGNARQWAEAWRDWAAIPVRDRPKFPAIGRDVIQVGSLRAPAKRKPILAAIPKAIEENRRNRGAFLRSEREKIFSPKRVWLGGEVKPAAGALLDFLKDETSARAVHKAMLHYERTFGAPWYTVRKGKFVARTIEMKMRTPGPALKRLAAATAKFKVDLPNFIKVWAETPARARKAIFDANGGKPPKSAWGVPDPRELCRLIPAAKQLVATGNKKTEETRHSIRMIARHDALVAVLRAYEAVTGEKPKLPSVGQLKSSGASATLAFVARIAAIYGELIPGAFDSVFKSNSTLQAAIKDAEK